jgi:hypothetical protein
MLQSTKLRSPSTTSVPFPGCSSATRAAFSNRAIVTSPAGRLLECTCEPRYRPPRAPIAARRCGVVRGSRDAVGVRRAGPAAASPAERRATAREAGRLRARIETWPVAHVRELLGKELGCAWWPARASEVRALLARAAQAGSSPRSR